ncbi:MAG: glutathione S-transferase family protein [Proteobacteria bacterium]|nr:glutathione S-transferase family protein [Pseudomonadota bacterium]MDA1308172.1 glutathione S-transferase family protein [Pseudomonadota bacterium]
MKLYGTLTSPYARLTRIVMLEKGLADRVELVWTKTRVADDPILAIHPSGRVPVLILDDGTVLEDTAVIVDYLDALAAPARFAHSADRRDWAYRGIEATARAMLDGLAVWAREVIRPAGEQSPGIIEHEARRAFRLADYFEGLLAKHRLSGPLTMAQIFLFGSLDVERRLPAFTWRDGRPSLVDWHARISELPSVRGSRPPSLP